MTGGAQDSGALLPELLAWADRALPMTDDASDFLNEGGWEQFGNIIARFRMSQMPVPLWQEGKGPIIREAQATEPSQRPHESYDHFLDGMQAAAEICGSLAETTYDDADQFEAATGCEAAIMECVREGRAKQAAAPAPAGWQPIESAPRDGTKVLIYIPAFDEIFASVFDKGVWQTGVWSNPPAFPTLWQPLPTAPAEGGV